MSVLSSGNAYFGFKNRIHSDLFGYVNVVHNYIIGFSCLVFALTKVDRITDYVHALAIITQECIQESSYWFFGFDRGLVSPYSYSLLSIAV